jgi:hypothetical protein
MVLLVFLLPEKNVFERVEKREEKREKREERREKREDFYVKKQEFFQFLIEKFPVE